MRLRNALTLLSVAVQIFGAAATAQSTRDAEGDADEAGNSDVPAPPSNIEEIVIHGSAAAPLPDIRTESVVLFDAEEITALGISDVSDLADFSPNLEIVSPGETTATFFIRGVGLQDFSANAPGAVAIYQDDVPLNSPPLQVPLIFDVENIAVLRGPQGTGVGRNATAGAIKLAARKPNLDSPEASLRLGNGSILSSVAHGSWIKDYEGGLGVPIVPEIAAGRLAFRLSQWDPFWQNGCTGAPPIEGRPFTFRGVCGESQVRLPRPSDANSEPARNKLVQPGLKKFAGNRDAWAARGQLRFQPPGTDMDWILNGHGSRRDQDGTHGQAIGTGPQDILIGGITSGGYIDPDVREERTELFNINRATGRLPAGALADQQLTKILLEGRPLDREPYRGDYQLEGRNLLDTYGTFLRGQMNFGETEFATTTGWDGFHRFSYNDADFTPDRLFHILSETNSWQLTQDFRFDRQLLDSLQADWGVYYLMERQTSTSGSNLIAGTTDPARGLTSNVVIGTPEGPFTIDPTDLASRVRDYRQHIWSLAAYGGFKWDLSEAFQVEGGVRYNFEKKDFWIEERSVVVNPRCDLPQVAGPLGGCRWASENTWHEPTGGLSLNWFITPDSSMYWKYTHGWKSGHFNTNAVPGVNNPFEPADPESIEAFEWGLKTAGFDSRIRANASLFYYLYKDYQVFVFEDAPSQGGAQLVVINAKSAEMLGAEFDLEIRPLQDLVPSSIEEFVFQLRGSWIRSEFLEFPHIFYVNNKPTLDDYSGNQLPNAPEFQFSGTLRWTFDLGRFGRITPRYDFTWQDDVFFDQTAGRGLRNGRNPETPNPEFTTGQAAYMLQNVRLSWTAPGGQFEVSGWCRNIMDERYKTYAFDVSNVRGVIINFVSDPRTCGGELNFTW